jgi:Peptidase family M23
MAIVLARIRMPLVWLSVVLLLLGWLVGVPFWAAMGLFVVAVAVYLRVGTVKTEPRAVALPVAGRWLAVNSPANRVPSHLVHAYGQTYAIDLVHVPDDGSRPAMAWRPLTRRPDDFPGFGRPVLAPGDAVVLRVRDGRRDHRSRTSWPAVAMMLLVEAPLRELGGPNAILGNHVVLDLGNCVYAVVAHLRRGSVRVAPGQRVATGEPIAECGNSGNSTEPHVHFQLMDRPNVLFAAGLPLTFRRFHAGGDARTGVPRNEEPFVAPTTPGVPDRPSVRSGW